MNTVQFPTAKVEIPDFDTLAKSVKTIKRSVPATSDAAYSYFADRLKLADSVVDDLDKQVTNALTSLPPSLNGAKQVQAILENITKINASEQAGTIPADKAAAARGQLQGKLGEAVSSTIQDFGAAATALSEPADRLSGYARVIEPRLEEATKTETSNQTRAIADAEREGNRLTILEERLAKLDAAVDAARGGPTEDIVALIPDEKELSSLLDLGAADAAAPEVAVAKKSIEMAVAQIKKVLALVDKTIKFVQLTELRNQVFAAASAQRKVEDAAQARLRAANSTLTVLDTVKAAGVAMASVAAETNKLATVFAGFVTQLQSLEGEQVTADTLTKSITDMESYLKRSREARNKVILT